MGNATPIHRLGILAAFLVPFLVYWYGLAPDIVIEGDSGEIIAGVFGFGVIHSPAFPGYMVLGKLFSQLVGFLDVALAVNLFSAFGGALAAAMIFYLGWGFGIGWLALLPAWFLAFAAEFWYASLAAEVYTWAVVVLLIPFVLSVALGKASPKRFHLTWGAALAFGISVHVYFWSLLPLYLWMMWRQIQTNKMKFIWPAFVGGLVLGFSPYLYIPLRAGKFFWINEGGINSWNRFFDHVSWVLQRERVPEQMHGNFSQVLTAKFQQLGYFTREVGLQWGTGGILILGLAAMGLWGFFKKTKGELHDFLKVSAVAALWTPLVVWLVFAGSEYRLSLMGEMSVHLLPLYTFICLLVIGGFALIREEIKAKGERALQVFSWSLMGLILILVAVRVPRFNLSSNKIAVSHGRDLLEHLAPQAILIGDSDNDLMPTVFLRSVRNLRPDVAVINISNGTEWYYENLVKLFPQLYWPKYRVGYIDTFVKQNISKHPVYFSNSYLAMQFMQRAKMGGEFKAVPMDGAYRMVERNFDACASVKSTAEKLQRQPLLVSGELPKFNLRGREVDVIAQWADYLFYIGRALNSCSEKELSQVVVQMGLALPGLGQTEFSAAIRDQGQRITN